MAGSNIKKYAPRKDQTIEIPDGDNIDPLITLPMHPKKPVIRTKKTVKKRTS